MSNTFNSSAGWGEGKADGGEVGLRVCVRACACAGAGGRPREFRGFFGIRPLCVNPMSRGRLTEGNAAFTHACRFVCEVLRDRKKYE